MTPIDWAIRPLKKYATFTGRAPRPEYWWYVLAILVVMLLLSFLERALGLTQMIGGLYGPITLLVSFGTFLPSLAAAVRRLHDSNRSGWWMLLSVPYLFAAIMAMRAMASGDAGALETAGLLSWVGIACALALLVFLVLPGTKGANRFGEAPVAS